VDDLARTNALVPFGVSLAVGVVDFAPKPHIYRAFVTTEHTDIMIQCSNQLSYATKLIIIPYIYGLRNLDYGKKFASHLASSPYLRLIRYCS